MELFVRLIFILFFLCLSVYLIFVRRKTMMNTKGKEHFYKGRRVTVTSIEDKEQLRKNLANELMGYLEGYGELNKDGKLTFLKAFLIKDKRPNYATSTYFVWECILKDGNKYYCSVVSRTMEPFETGETRTLREYNWRMVKTGITPEQYTIEDYYSTGSRFRVILKDDKVDTVG